MRTWSRTLHLPDLSLGRSSIVLALLAVGLASEALYLASVVDPWWFWDHFPPGSQRSPLTTANSLAGFAISMVDLFALYALAAYLLRRASLVEGPVAAAILFGFPCLFGASLLLAYPVLSGDIFHYVMEGRILWVHGDNPLVAVPGNYPLDPYLPFVDKWHHFVAAPYGPLWLLFTGIPTALPDSEPELVLIGFKALTTGFYLATSVLVWLILKEIAPERRYLGTLLFAWNPLLLLSAAAMGHNDSVMMFFVALSLYLAVKGQWWLAVPALVLSGLVKYVTFLLLPVYLLYVWRHGSIQARRSALFGVGIAAVLAVAIFVPFWEGFDTFTAQRSNQRTWFANSFAEVGVLALAKIASLDFAMQTSRLLTVLLYLPLYLLLLLRLQSNAGEFRLIVYQVMFVYLLLASTLFYPWYVFWALALGAAIIDSHWSLTALLLSFTAVFVDIVQRMVSHLGFLHSDTGLSSTVTVLVVLGPPAMLWLAFAWRWRPWRLNRRRASKPSGAIGVIG